MKDQEMHGVKPFERMNLQDRADNYLTVFPDYMPIQIFNDRLYSVWIMGNNYQNSSKYYGEYPHSLLKRIKSLFPDCRNIMHLFSGPISEDLTFDIKKELNPVICDDVCNIKTHKNIIENIDLVIADPPYDKSDFEKYGCKSFSKIQVIRDLGEIMKSGSFLVWLDTRIPMYSKIVWDLVGYIGVIVSTNHRVRCLCIYQKKD
jgi:hypothetical protein